MHTLLLDQRGLAATDTELDTCLGAFDLDVDGKINKAEYTSMMMTVRSRFAAMDGSYSFKLSSSKNETLATDVMSTTMGRGLNP